MESLCECVTESDSECKPSASKLVRSLHKAIRNKNVSKVEMCLCDGANVNSTVGNRTALYLAVHVGFTKILRVLFKHGAKSSVRGTYWYEHRFNCRYSKFNAHGRDFLETPLHLAVKRGNVEIIKILLNDADDYRECLQIEDSQYAAVVSTAMEIVNDKVTKIIINHGGLSL